MMSLWLPILCVVPTLSLTKSLEVNWKSTESKVASHFTVGVDGLIFTIDNQSLHALRADNGKAEFTVPETTVQSIAEHDTHVYTSDKDCISAYTANGTRQFSITRNLYNFGPVNVIADTLIVESGYFHLASAAQAAVGAKSPPPFPSTRFGMLALDANWSCPESLEPADCEASRLNTQQHDKLIKWQFDDFSQFVDMDGILMSYTYTIGPDATVYVHTAEWNGTLNIGYFTAIRDGALLWRTRHGPCHALHGDPVLGPDGTLYQGFYEGVDHEDDAKLTAWDSKGNLKWITDFHSRFTHNYISFSSKVSLAADGSLRVATQDRTGEGDSDYSNTLYAVDGKGGVLWNCSLPSGKLPGWIDGISTALLLAMAPDDVTYSRVNGTKVSAVNARGEKLWTDEVTTDPGDTIESFVVDRDGTLFAVIQHDDASGNPLTSSIYSVKVRGSSPGSQTILV